MPMGPWPDVQACLDDDAMMERYPDEAQRKRVCGAIKQRLEGKAEPGAGREERGDGLIGKVTDGEEFWIVRDAVAAKEGVNVRGEFKPWSELVKAAPTLEGVPLIYGAPGHPRDEAGRLVVRVPSNMGVGIAVNVRADEASRRILYDAVLWKKAPDGVRADTSRNRDLVEHVRVGGEVQNSVGYDVGEPRKEAGRFGDSVYQEVQHGITFGHVLILKPFSTLGGACGPACSIGADADEHESGCDGGEGCCRVRAAAAADAIVAATGVSRGAAFRVIREAGQKV